MENFPAHLSYHEKKLNINDDDDEGQNNSPSKKLSKEILDFE